jgi:hypothetical protein
MGLPEIPITAREIHATVKKISKYELNVLQSGSRKDLRVRAKGGDGTIG